MTATPGVDAATLGRLLYQDITEALAGPDDGQWRQATNGCHYATRVTAPTWETNTKGSGAHSGSNQGKAMRGANRKAAKQTNTQQEVNV